jgi:hypothetical protein
MNTPLLLISWRRPHTLRQVIDAIRPVGPKRLYVACDGPNPERPGEAEKVAATRAVIQHEIDWPCHVERLYSDVNQGCRLGPSRAITWFFEQVTEGIILEDDCIPHPDFLRFCSELLAIYRDDQRIFQVSGFNAIPSSSIQHDEHPYFFSEYGSIWGWATWRRAWNCFDESLDPVLSSGHLQLAVDGLEPWERPDKRRIHIEKVRSGLDAWDYQWFFARLMHRGLSVVPATNLIQNVGFSEDPSHPSGLINASCVYEGFLPFPLNADRFRVVNRKHDRLLLHSRFTEPSRLSRILDKLSIINPFLFHDNTNK